VSHYFIENPQLLTHERKLHLKIFNLEFEFLTNNGFFSHTEIDSASQILLEYMPPIQGSLLDLGCGYGVLGIVLAKKNKVTLTISDINSLALEYAIKNAKKNNVEARAIHSNSFSAFSSDDKFNHIVLNPPIHAGKNVMYHMYEESAKHLHIGGALYIVIHKKHGAESTLKKLSEIFTTCQTLYKKKGLFVFKGTVSLV